MPATTLSTKGQIVLPQALRKALGWTPGTRLSIEETSDGVLLRAEPAMQHARLEDVVGMLNRYASVDRPAFTVEEMDAALLEAVAEDYERSCR